MPRRYALSDSESEADSDAPPVPSDETLEKALRDAVAHIYKTGNMEELTVKRVRLAAEKSLQLEEGYFKSIGDWKTRSDQIIKDEVEVQDTAAQETRASEDEEDKSPASPAPAKPTKRAKSNPSAASCKHRKTNSESEVASESAGDDSEGEPAKPGKRQKKVAPKKKTPQRASPDTQTPGDSDAKAESDAQSPQQKMESGDESESEMSVVLDEEPKPKRQRKSNSKGAEAASGKAKKKTATKGKDTDTDPDQAEIKRLQGWLIKCGIRKMWFRELAPYDTPKAKIKHLKDMLKEAGMEGRYSLEKARQIKEERELRADLELVQEGAKRWGKECADDASDSGPRRRLNRGRKTLAFLESEGEETD